MRKNLGPKSLFYPEPVIIIGTYDENNIVNAMNAAWGGISDTNELGICLSPEHKTTKNILLKKFFTASVGTVDTLVQCDYVGVVSGNKEINKIEKCGLHPIKSENIDAPLFDELPLALECELISYDKSTGHMFAKILNVSCKEEIMSDGKVDVKKLQPLIFDGDTHNYLSVGDIVGKAFCDYKKIK